MCRSRDHKALSLPLPLLLLQLLLPPTLPAQQMFEQPLSPRIANYTIAVTLDDSLKQLSGTLRLTWRNPSADTIPDLQFHLYLNAFRDPATTLARSYRRFPWADGGNGWIEIESLAVRGQPHTQAMRFIAPNDGNSQDHTVLHVPLRQRVRPRETIEVDIEFRAQLPRNHLRTGWWGDDFFFVAQWFPKIAVYETPGMRFVPADARRGRWNCHQFHRITEFYADFGVYDVQITAPARYTVGTTGVITDIREHDDGTRTYTARAEDVHDFAWVADARALEIVEPWTHPRGGQDVTLRLLLQPEHVHTRDAYLASAKHTLDYFDRWLGHNAYPYPILTIVDPAPGSGAGGMEYPTLITGGLADVAWLLSSGGIRLVEAVTIHELAHQYWYGMVANNEFEEAFLDEGFATYSEIRISADMLGPRTSFLDAWGLQASLASLRRAGYALDDGKRDATLADFTYTRPGHIGLAYDKGSLTLATLENYLGRETFDNVIRTYFERWRFRHPCRDDFIAVANEVAGENLDWFFDQLIFGDGVVDYQVAEISNRRNPVALDADSLEVTPAYSSRVRIRRLGEVSIPVEIVVGFADGSRDSVRWDGKERLLTLNYERNSRVTRAVVDPHHKIPLDVDLMNNSQTPPNEVFVAKYRWKWLFWLQRLLTFMSIFS